MISIMKVAEKLVYPQNTVKSGYISKNSIFAVYLGVKDKEYMDSLRTNMGELSPEGQNIWNKYFTGDAKPLAIYGIIGAYNDKYNDEVLYLRIFPMWADNYKLSRKLYYFKGIVLIGKALKSLDIGAEGERVRRALDYLGNDGAINYVLNNLWKTMIPIYGWASIFAGMSGSFWANQVSFIGAKVLGKEEDFTTTIPTDTTTTNNQSLKASVNIITIILLTLFGLSVITKRR